jgi:UDP-sugar diphosphatase
MDDPLQVSDFTVHPIENTKYVKPVTLKYKQNNTNKTWEAVQAHDSVAILLYHTTNDSFILVKQFRPPVFMHHKEYSYTFELCAGIIDKDCSLEQIAIEEIEEECGYQVEIKDIEKISSFFTNVGVSGAKQHLYFAKIDENMKINDGGGIHDEQIEIVELPLVQAKQFVYDESKAKTPGLMFAFYWFFEKYNKV